MRTGSKHFHLTLTSNVNYFETGLELTVLWISGKVENIGRLSIRGSNNACYFGVGLFLDYPFCDFWNTLNLQDLDFLRSGQIEQKTDMRETNGFFFQEKYIPFCGHRVNRVPFCGGFTTLSRDLAETQVRQHDRLKCFATPGPESPFRASREPEGQSIPKMDLGTP